MEICTNEKYIAVWLTKEEQQHYNRQKLTDELLKNVENPKCKVVFFLSGNEELYRNIEGLLIHNLQQKANS